MHASIKTGLLAATGVVLTLFASASGANAVPIEWTTASGGNGHFYDAVLWGDSAGENWAAARTDALTQYHNGQQGYLLTITSAAEAAFVFSIFQHATINGVTGPNGIIGANDLITEGVWVWADGPEAGQQFWQGGTGGTATAPFNYANWFSGEPNNQGNEDVGQIHPGGWNDFPETAVLNWRYYVEYNAAPIVTEPPRTSVPEPMTLSLLAAGLAGIGWLRRRASNRTDNLWAY